MKITGVSGRMILDSRGVPTVEATVRTEKGAASAGVPAGTSTGRHEAKELRDGGDRWNGQGVRQAVSHVNVEISHALQGMDATDQAAIDAKLTELDKSKKPGLGANALLAVSVATFLAAARGKRKEPWQMLGGESPGASQRGPKGIPVPMLNLINGGAHAKNGLEIQEFMVVPLGFDTFSEALRAATETYHALGTILDERNLGTGVGLEGGFAPQVGNHHDALDLLVQAIERAKYRPGEQIGLALDVAATELYKEGAYKLAGQTMQSEQLAIEYESLLRQYPIVSIEDPFAEDDWDGWAAAPERVKTGRIADDLTVTDAKRIKRAAGSGATGVIIKPNQQGTLTAATAAVAAARAADLTVIASHRSGETTDHWIADLAVGWEAEYIKAGAPARGERVAKYDRLLAIEQEFGSQAVYRGPGLAAGKEAAPRGTDG
ncbi:MAG: phosphopyruvate hydratase [bacterium]|nr:phosphopyruvate hydratase [bacterium]MDZ4247972.1 phosphopyruvate hydratase [Patescibacteria group bacterium]